MDFINYSFLFHHGIKGMHWGIRRFQNPDGSLTQEGKERYTYANRSRRAAKTKNDMDNLYNTLSDQEKVLLGDDNKAKEWLTLEQGEFVVKRFLKKYGDTTVAALDVMTTNDKKQLTVAIMTDPKYRGKGLASELAKKSIKWFDKNADKYGATELEWGAYSKNKSSRHIAEKSGFKYDKKNSDEEWSSYKYKKKQTSK